MNSPGVGQRSAVNFSVSLLAILLSGPSEATPFDGRPKILLHAQGVTLKAACEAGSLADCQDAVTEAPISDPQFVYLLAAKGNMLDVGGMVFTLAYQENCPDNDSDRLGLDILAWTLCASLQFSNPAPVWPEPYSRTRILWDTENNCQSGDVAVAGYFYTAAYSSDVLQITAQPVARLTSCAYGKPAGRHAEAGDIEVYLDDADLGHVAFSPAGSTPGCNPCDGPCPGPLIPPPPPACQPPPPPPPGNNAPAILVHLTSVTAKNACSAGALEFCSNAVVKGGLSAPDVGPYYFVNLLAHRGSLSSVAGLQCGISYDNNTAGGASNGSRIDVFSWTLCASLEFQMPSPSWPSPGAGNLITWDAENDCQTGNTALAGYFYVGAYSSDVFRIIPRPVDGQAKLANCVAAETVIPESSLGFAAFSAGQTTAGCNPCVLNCASAVPVHQTTWSGVKTLFH